MKAVPPLGDTAPAAADTAPAARDAAPAAKAPSGPPGGTTAPPTRPATGAPVRSVPSAGPRVIPRPQEEPEPIDLLEVAGGAAMARYAAPAAGVAGRAAAARAARPPSPPAPPRLAAARPSLAFNRQMPESIGFGLSAARVAASGRSEQLVEPGQRGRGDDVARSS